MGEVNGNGDGKTGVVFDPSRPAVRALVGGAVAPVGDNDPEAVAQAAADIVMAASVFCAAAQVSQSEAARMVDTCWPLAERAAARLSTQGPEQ